MKIKEGTVIIEMTYSELRVLRWSIEDMTEPYLIARNLEDDDIYLFRAIRETIQNALDRTVIYKGE